MVSQVGQLDKFARCMDKIVTLGPTPKAILVSGGGDDIAGKEFGMLIIVLRTIADTFSNDTVLSVAISRVLTKQTCPPASRMVHDVTRQVLNIYDT
jgi:hypothetical protein